MNTTDPKYQRALERVGKEKAFYSSIFSYVVIVGLLAGLNYYSNEFRHPWVLWVALFWGLSILLRGFRLFGGFNLFGKGWEERKIREYMDKDRFS